MKPYRIQQRSTWTRHVGSVVFLLMLTFVLGRSYAVAQTWTRPLSQPPTNNSGQPPGLSGLTDVLRVSPIGTQVLTGSLFASFVSSFPVELANPNSRRIGVYARNAFTDPVSFPSTVDTGVFGYGKERLGLAASAEGGVGQEVYAVMGRGESNAYAAQFVGAVNVSGNGAAAGTMTVANLVEAAGGLLCNESTSSCTLLSAGYAIDASNTGNGVSVLALTTVNNTNAISVNINDAVIQNGEAARGFSTLDAGVRGYSVNAAGLQTFAEKISGLSTTVPRGIVGYALTTPGAGDIFGQRKGIYGLVDPGATVGVGTPNYGTSGSPKYDIAAGIRACYKDSAGLALNSGAGVHGEGGIFAGYFDGTGIPSPTGDEGNLMIADAPSGAAGNLILTDSPQTVQLTKRNLIDLLCLSVPGYIHPVYYPNVGDCPPP